MRRVEEVQRMVKAGSKRTPNHPACCSKTQGGRGGSERRLYPPDEGTTAEQEGGKKPTSLRPFGGQMQLDVCRRKGLSHGQFG